MPQPPSPTTLRWSAQEVPPPGNFQEFRRLAASSPGSVILESTMLQPRWGRYSIFAIDPVRVCGVRQDEWRDPFCDFADVCRPWYDLSLPGELPFAGGWIGHLSYEAGRFTEPAAWPRSYRQTPLSLDGTPLPLCRWSLFDTVLIHDLMEDRWIAAGVELPPNLAGSARPALPERLARLRDLLVNGSAGADRPAPDARRGDRERLSNWNYSREAYLAKVERTLEYIRAGDIFQANIARRCRVTVSSHPLDIYERLQEVNPSTFAAYLPLPSPPGATKPAAIISASPELFLQLRAGKVTTRPIKGTRPRGATKQNDEEAARALAASTKDRAELNMIIDLERNDLGRVCEYGTVRVESEGDIETLPTVFHRTATITGRLREDADAIDLLRATFPGGSITGAPKVRAMQIINELEPTLRGPYCGAIGYIGLNGDLMLNLAIRTMVVRDGMADVMVGSGIVADSDPEDEYAELEAKAAGMFAALRAAASRRPVHSEMEQTAY